MDMRARTGEPARTIGQAWLYLVTDTLRLSDEGAAAHMSLHLDQQCQRAQTTDALAYPSFEGLALASGDLMTASVSADQVGVRRCGDTHLCWAVGRVKRFFAFF